VTIGLVEATKIIGQALANNLTIFFLSIWIEKKIIRYVKMRVKFECNDNCFEINYEM
jgi:hypothetical protein